MSNVKSLEHRINERIGIIARAQQRVNREGTEISEETAHLCSIQETFELNNLIQAEEFVAVREEVRDAAVAVYGLMLPQAREYYEKNMQHLKVNWVEPSTIISSTVTL